ncbi:hypothetical protein TTRE_0000557801 [Trichuris trichiura]|uniref:Uncharacterized protein n=1 Tax=Trichuris trichiura TaxID=36087 RepID=A0A077ZA73_TRITR|nr:hypothetical protein TTRE_0000557801 [Trichuris trichiura]
MTNQSQIEPIDPFGKLGPCHHAVNDGDWFSLCMLHHGYVDERNLSTNCRSRQYRKYSAHFCAPCFSEGHTENTMAFYFALFNVTSVNLKERVQRMDYTQIGTQRRGHKSFRAAKPRKRVLNHAARMVEENRANERKAAMMHFLQSTSTSDSTFDMRTKSPCARKRFNGNTAPMEAALTDEQEQPNVTHRKSSRGFLLLEKMKIYEMIVSWWRLRQRTRCKDSKVVKRNKPADNRAQTADSSPLGRSSATLQNDNCSNALLEIRWVITDEYRKVKTEPLNRKFFRGSEKDNCRKQSINWYSYRNYAFQMHP